MFVCGLCDVMCVCGKNWVDCFSLGVVYFGMLMFFFVWFMWVCMFLFVCG